MRHHSGETSPLLAISEGIGCLNIAIVPISHEKSLPTHPQRLPQSNSPNQLQSSAYTLFGISPTLRSFFMIILAFHDPFFISPPEFRFVGS